MSSTLFLCASPAPPDLFAPITLRPHCAASDLPFHKQQQQQWRPGLGCRRRVLLGLGAVNIAWMPPLPAQAASVESILARQLARRFREMSDEELAEVLEQLFYASKSFSLMSEDRAVGEQESSNQRLPMELRRDSSSEVLGSAVIGRGADRGNARIELGSDAEATSSSKQITDQAEGTSGVQQSIAKAGVNGTDDEGDRDSSVKEFIPPEFAEDSKLSRLSVRKGKDTGGETDMTSLLWKELQKRLEKTGGAREMATEGSSKSEVRYDPQGLFRDRKVVVLGLGVLAVNSVLTVGQWKFLDSRAKYQLDSNNKSVPNRSAISSGSSSSRLESNRNNRDEDPGLLRSLRKALQNTIDQFRDIGKAKRQQGELLSESSILKPRLEIGDEKRSREISYNNEVEDDQPFSARLASIRNASSKGQRQGWMPAVVSPVLDNKGSKTSDSVTENFELKSAKPSTSRSDTEDAGEDSESFGHGRQVEDAGSRRYGKERLAGDSMYIIEKGWGKRSLPPSLRDDKGQGSKKASSISGSSFKSTTGEIPNRSFSYQPQGPDPYDEDLLFNSYGNNVQNTKLEANTITVRQEKDKQRGNGHTTLASNGSHEEYGGGKCDKLVKSVMKGNGTNHFMRIEVDYWANTNGSVGPSRVSGMPSYLEDAGVSKEMIKNIREDHFMHNGALWTRDSDGVFVKQLTINNDCLHGQSHIEDRKANEQSRSHLFAVSGTILDSGTTNPKINSNSSNGRHFVKRTASVTGPGFDYRKLVLQHSKNDIP